MSAASSNDRQLEIPGFYRDPETGRYFREDNLMPLPKRQRVEQQAEEQTSFISSRPRHFPELLSQRETGILRNTNFNSCFFDLKVNDMKWNGPRRANTTWHERYDVTADVVLLKGGSNRMYGVWQVYHETSLYNIIGEIPYVYTRNPDVGSGHFRAKNSVVDFCFLCDETRYILYITNHPTKGEGLIHLAVQQPENIHMNYYPTPRYLPYSIFCCKSNDYCKKFAVGGANNISIVPAETVPLYSVPGGHLNVISIRGRIHAIEWNTVGNILFSGLHNGRVEVIDLREKKIAWRAKLYNVGIDEIKVLTDENYLICGTFNGSLCKVDMRMRRKVAEYFGHVHTPKKCPFSVSERMDLLAATGTDNVTRIWNLEGGNLLKTVRPPQPDVPHRTWLFCNKSSTSLGCVQGKDFYFTRI